MLFVGVTEMLCPGLQTHKGKLGVLAGWWAGGGISGHSTKRVLSDDGVEVSLKVFDAAASPTTSRSDRDAGAMYLKASDVPSASGSSLQPRMVCFYIRLFCGMRKAPRSSSASESHERHSHRRARRWTSEPSLGLGASGIARRGPVPGISRRGSSPKPRLASPISRHRDSTTFGFRKKMSPEQSGPQSAP